VASFIEFSPLSKEISHHVKYVLIDRQWTDGQRTDGWTNGKHVASAHVVGRGIETTDDILSATNNASVRDSH